MKRASELLRFGAAALLLLGGTRLASAQSAPNWVKGYVPPASEWITNFANKADVTNGTLNNPTIANPTISGGTLTGTLTGPDAGTWFSGGISGLSALSAGTSVLGTGSTYNLTVTGGTTGVTFGVNSTGAAGGMTFNTRNGQPAGFNNQVSAANFKAAGNGYVLSGSTVPTPFGNFGGNPTGTSTVGGGITLDTPLFQFAGVASIVSGGTNYTSTDMVDDGFGDLFSVTASGGVVSSLTPIKRGEGLAASPSGTISMNTLVSTGGTRGSGLQITETTWTQATTLNLGTVAVTALNLGNSSSTTTIAGVLKGAAATFTANGSVGATLTSLGPTGSHTTVQEWFTITDASGAVRYIPAY